MKSSRYINDVFCQWPSRPIGLIEIIGGSYLCIKPEITYKRIIEELFKKNFAVHAWSFIPIFDHQIQANQAWKSLRSCRKILEKRVGIILPPIRLGHSLGCKLHLLAPDGGTGSKGLLAISFNNFAANKSIPMLRRISDKLKLQTEFSPSPNETLNLINKYYEQQNNLIISFTNDNLDQSSILLDCLKVRRLDNSKRLILNGSHLTPVSLGLRGKLLKSNFIDSSKYKSIDSIINIISKWDI